MNRKAHPMKPFETAVYIAPLPRNWEKALGYTPQTPRRWLLAYWTPFGDEAMYEDGIVSATGNWQPYLDVVNSDAFRRRLSQHFGFLYATTVLGGSDSEGTHCLLCDLTDRQLYVATLEEARTFLKSPLPEGYQPPTIEQQRAAGDAFQAQLASWRTRLAQEREGKQLILCFACMGGYVRADDGGYDLCSACKGDYARRVPLQAGESPTIEIWQELPLPEDLLADIPPSSEA